MKRESAKEPASSLFNRYVWLVNLIYRARNIKFEEINDKWTRSALNNNGADLPLRTFHNHREAINEMFQIEIKCDRRNEYSYYIDNADEMEQEGVRSWLLNTFAVNNLISESSKLKQRILFEKIPSGQKFLVPIIEAMRDGVSIEMSYQNYRQEAPFTMELQPYCLKIFRQRWYVIGNNLKEQVHIYALDRVKSLSTTANKFILPADFNGEEYFSHSYGISNRGCAQLIEVKALKRMKIDLYFKSLPLHHSQEIVEEGEGYTIFRYFIQPTYDFRQELLSHGAEVEVLSPKWFRDEIAKVIKEQANKYL